MIISDALSQPAPITIRAEPTAVIRHAAVTIAELPGLFDTGYRTIAASGVSPAGPAFALYRGDPAGVFELELGFPVSQPLSGPVPGEPVVLPSTLPAGPALALTHWGSYDSLSGGWERLLTEARGRGLSPEGWLEVYVTEPTPDSDPAALRTDLLLLVRGDQPKA